MPAPKEKTPAVSSTPKAQPTTQTPAPTAAQTAPQSQPAPEKNSAVHAEQSESNTPRIPTRDEIEAAAYLLYLERGGLDGFAEEDWLQAERDLIEGAAAQQKSRAKGA